MDTGLPGKGFQIYGDRTPDRGGEPGRTGSNGAGEGGGLPPSNGPPS